MQARSPEKIEYPKAWQRISSGAFIAGILGLSMALSTNVAQAGFLSSLWAAVGNEQVSAKTTPASPSPSRNSQNIQLLTAQTSNPLAYSIGIATTTPPIDDGSTLSPDMAAANQSPNAEPFNTQISTYIVQDDDTISGIANMFDISVDTIKQANGLAKSTIRPGQSLTILPVTGLLYTVVKNDSLQKIAVKYKVSADDIIVYNGLSAASSTVYIGEKLVIPHGKPSAEETRTYLAKQKIPSFEPLLDAVWNWPSYPGMFACPVPGARLSQGLHGHNAVDFAISAGTPIHAAAAGTVIVSKSNGLWNGGYGNFVMIMHGSGVETLYAHMLRSAVSSGQSVAQGQVIGYIGSTGMSTGPHTHFEIRGAQNPFVDPALCH